jgi:N-acyl-D-aspartate/D-glutamate deacylase
MGNLLITGGLVVDGTGAPALAADVRIRDGRILELAPGDRGRADDLLHRRAGLE